MNERIGFADIELELAGFLTTRLATAADTAVVVTRVPEPRPVRMVRVIRDDRRSRTDTDGQDCGLGSRLILDRPRIVLECTDDTGTAAGLAALVRSVLSSAAPGYLDTVWCDQLTDVGVENDTDPVTAAPRYTLVTDLVVRGTVLA